jgi:AIPR protein
MKKPVVFSIPVFSIRRIETPFERRPGYKNYLAVIDVRHLPDLEDWRDINVRDAKLRGRVPAAIRRSFAEKPEEFFFMNRGMVIAAERVEFSEGSAQKKIELVMRDPEIHGLLDGGHTYRVVSEASKAMDREEATRYVRVEIITGFDRESISDVVEARNTSNQVRDESLANLRQEFEPLKDVLKNEPYAELIAWSEYEELTTGKAKPIDVRDVISYLIAFDTHEYNSTNQPLIAYKDKRACLKHFQAHEKQLRKLYPLLPDILRMWDDIHLSWRTWYNKGRSEESGHEIDGRFGKLTAVSPAPEMMYFREVNADWRMPEAYKYPILSAMRAAIRVTGKSAQWATDPFDLLNSCGEQLAAIVGNSIRATNNPNKVGKDVGVWSSCYLVVTNSLQGTITNKAEKKIKELEAQLAEFKRAAR